jgi:prephenate dehydrogenase
VTRAAVVGIGLIGGSVALGLRARAFDRDEVVRKAARRRGIDVAESLPEALDGADLIVAAVATLDTPAVLQEAAARAPAALLTDVASLKRPAADLAAGLPPGVRYVGGHPMAGGSPPGLDGARATLFAGRPWLIVPTQRSDASSIERVSAEARRLGALPVLVEAERHDALMAWISHLPLAVAASLARAVARAAPEAGAFAGPGLLDTTRLAGARLDLALELWSSDPLRLAAAVDSVAGNLTELAALLRGGDRSALEAFLLEAARARETITGKTKPRRP